MEYLKINAGREGYTPNQCHSAMTVGELIEALQEYDEDILVYLSHDDGYMFGSLAYSDIELADTDE